MAKFPSLNLEDVECSISCFMKISSIDLCIGSIWYLMPYMFHYTNIWQNLFVHSVDVTIEWLVELIILYSIVF